jgi:hypothetical protein
MAAETVPRRSHMRSWFSQVDLLSFSGNIALQQKARREMFLRRFAQDACRWSQEWRGVSGLACAADEKIRFSGKGWSAPPEPSGGSVLLFNGPAGELSRIPVLGELLVW